MQQSPEGLAGPHFGHYNELHEKLNPLAKEEVEAAQIAAFLKGAKGVKVAQLSQIWEIASEFSGCKNRAALNHLGIFMCFKLVAAAQQGLPLSPSVLSHPSLGPPQFDFLPSQIGPSPLSSIPPSSVPPPLSALHRQSIPSKSPSMASELGGGGQLQEMGWTIGQDEQRKYDAIFDSLGPFGDRLSGEQCRPVLLNSQLPKAILAKIWDLADMDADGHLDRPEFCVALHLVYRALQNEPIPERLPLALVPFIKRPLMRQMSVRSVEPQSHPPPLSWSSRASSLASLNYFPQPHQAAPISPLPIGQSARKPPSSLFDRNVEEWRIDNLDQFESEFVELDKDRDGFINGADVRDVFLRSGLAHPTLARIWAHVDVEKSGRLNLEQYAKCVLLIRECQQPQQQDGTTAEASSPPPILPPPAGGLGRRDSQISTNSSTGTSGTKMAPQIVAENPRVQELMAAIEAIQSNRRQADQDLFQAEADMKVKNSEVKNLEIELLTLEATVKQLRNQRVEANKRLNDLDTKIAKMEGIFGDGEKRLEEEEARLTRTKMEIQQAKENSGQEGEELEKLKAEVREKKEEMAKAQQKFHAENRRFEGFVDELTQMERGMARQEEEGQCLKEQIDEMKRILEGVEKQEEGAIQQLLDKTFQGPRENSTSTKLPPKLAGASFGDGVGLPFPPDPFKEDPFEGAAEDPFSGGGANSTAGATTIPSADGDDPFAPKMKNGQKEQKEEATGGGGTQFASFANFSAFS